MKNTSATFLARLIRPLLICLYSFLLVPAGVLAQQDDLGFVVGIVISGNKDALKEFAKDIDSLIKQGQLTCVSVELERTKGYYEKRSKDKNFEEIAYECHNTDPNTFKLFGEVFITVASNPNYGKVAQADSATDLLAPLYDEVAAKTSGAPLQMTTSYCNPTYCIKKDCGDGNLICWKRGSCAIHCPY